MSAQFTPGPWSTSAVTETEVIGPRQRTICRAHRDATTRSEDETRANARLIAAAPDLYETLAEAPGLPTTFDQYDRFASEYRAFREKRNAALAKARGDQP